MLKMWIIVSLVVMWGTASFAKSPKDELKTLGDQLSAAVSTDIDTNLSGLTGSKAAADDLKNQHYDQWKTRNDKLAELQTQVDNFKLPPTGKSLMGRWTTTPEYDEAVANKAILAAKLKKATEEEAQWRTTWNTANDEVKKYDDLIGKAQAKKDKVPGDVAKRLKELEAKLLQQDLRMSIDGALNLLNDEKIKLTDVKSKMGLIEKSYDNALLGGYVREKFERFAGSKEICSAVSKCPEANPEVNLDKLFHDKSGNLGVGRGGVESKTH